MARNLLLDYRPFERNNYIVSRFSKSANSKLFNSLQFGTSGATFS
jgi:hypothetical protein